VLVTVGKTAAASVLSAAAALAVVWAVPNSLGEVPRAWLELVLGGLAGGAVALGAMLLLRVHELRSVASQLRARAGS
jgi:putative peptidoglycan lipid II flippase